MKKILALFKKSFLFPFTALLGGIPAGASGTDEQEPQEESTEAEDHGDQEEEAPENEDAEQPVNMTQKQLDDLIKRTLRRGEKKGRAAAAKSEGGEQENGKQDKADERLELANKLLLQGTVKNIASDMDLTKKGATAALKLADFSGCIDKDGEIDEESVKDALKEFAEEYPEFTKSEPSNKAWGMKQGRSGTTSGVEEAFKRLNPDLKF